MRAKNHPPGDDAMLLAGDADAFGRFYRRHEEAVLRFFVRVVRRPEVAADLTAETFARALVSRRSFDPRLGDARGWLFGIARHVLARSLEAGRVEDEARTVLQMERVTLTDSSLARIEQLGDDKAHRALEALPVEQRLAVVGRVVDERDYPSLAEHLQCSESLARQRVSRGLRTLRSLLGGTR